MMFKVFLLQQNVWTDLANWIISISAFGSFVILAFYTYYTKQMQVAVKEQAEELINQRRLGILPFIVIKVKEDSLEVSNFGNGIALNIKMKSVKLENLTEEEESYRLLDEASIEAPTIALLKPNQQTDIKVKSKSLKENNPKIIEICQKIYAGHLAFGIIEFQDIQGNIYQQDLRENENKVQRHSFPKLLDCREE